jgi:hypothetical protein
LFDLQFHIGANLGLEPLDFYLDVVNAWQKVRESVKARGIRIRGPSEIGLRISYGHQGVGDYPTAGVRHQPRNFAKRLTEELHDGNQPYRQN